MKRLLLLAAGLVACLAGPAACNRDDTLLQDDVTMGRVISAADILTDQGLTYHVVGQDCEGDLSAMDRVLLSCDILRFRGGTTYDIRLKQLLEPLCKPFVTASALPDAPDDPVDITACWNGAGYINMQCQFFRVPGSGAVHVLNLVLDDSAGDTGTLHFRLSHDACGEISGSEAAEGRTLELVRTYATFPAESLIPAEETAIPVEITFPWHKGSGSAYLPEVADKTLTLLLIR